MSKADDFARTLMEDTGGGRSVAPTGDPVPAAVPLAPAPEGDYSTLPVEQLQRGRYQPRGVIDPDSLTELAESVRAQGIVQPIVVRPVETGRFEIVAGERRWRAAQLAGLATVPVVIRDLDDSAAMQVALIENIQREDLNPLEEANALRTLAAHYETTTERVADQRSLASMVGKSITWVSRRLALLEQSVATQDSVANGVLALEEALRQSRDAATAPKPQKTVTKPRSEVRVDFGVLQASVKHLSDMAATLNLAGIDLPSRPTRKDYSAAFEQRIVEILDAAYRSIKPE